MNVRCPQCQTVYRVDPEKVPIAGVRTRCARCNALFGLSRSGVAGVRPAAPPPARTMPAASPAAVPPVIRPTHPVSPPPAAAAPSTPTPTRAAPATPPAARPIPPIPAPAATGAPSSPPSKRPSFLKQDPNTRAQRLARALVSDIVAYNREKRDQMLVAGTLKSEFREEIRKSWEEYVAQVGLEMARNTPFFRDALNEILAEGQPIF